MHNENTDTNGLCDNGRVYYLADANMNVTTLVDINGDALERYISDPYGRVTIYDATWSNVRSSSSYSNYVLFTGRHLDPETSLYYYRARYHSAELGRFVSRNPIGYRGGKNLYGYCRGNPLMYHAKGTDGYLLNALFLAVRLELVRAHNSSGIGHLA